jgi:DNA-binding PadR family transcriptional regulator
MLRYLLLGLLRGEGPRHGYALMKEYRRSSGYSLSIGNVYRELQRLRSEGLVRTVASSPGVDPRRIAYEITATGSKAFDTWLHATTDAGFREVHDAYLLRGFFVARGEASRELLDTWHDELAAHRRLLERARAAAEGSQSREHRATLPLWLTRRLQHLAIDLDFVESLRCTRPHQSTSTPASEKAPTSRRALRRDSVNRSRTTSGPVRTARTSL